MATIQALWSSDKIVNQMILAEEIAKLVIYIAKQHTNYLIIWIAAAFSILNKEWIKIDYYRINKFLSLVRFLLRYIFIYWRTQKWNSEVC